MALILEHGEVEWKFAERASTSSLQSVMEAACAALGLNASEYVLAKNEGTLLDLSQSYRLLHLPHGDDCFLGRVFLYFQ
jgi:hypothetical protein